MIVGLQPLIDISSIENDEDKSIAQLNENYNLHISNNDKSSGNGFPSEINDLSPNIFININGVEKNMVENENPARIET